MLYKYFVFTWYMYTILWTGTAVVRAEKVSEAHGGESKEDISGGLGIKDILFTFKCLLTNPTFMFLNLAAAAEGDQ